VIVCLDVAPAFVHLKMITRYKQILKKEKISGKEMAEILGISYSSYRSMTRNKTDSHPRWVRSFVIAYELTKLEK